MQWKYGGYSFQSNNVSGTWRWEPYLSDSGVQLGQTKIAELSGKIDADTQAALTTAINSLTDALEVNGGDLILLDNSGNNSAVVMRNNESISGVRVTSFTLPNLRNAEYTTFVNFTVRFEAEYQTSNITYETFDDSLAITGDGTPRRVVLEGAFRTTEQFTRQQTRVTAVQSGQGTNSLGFPPPAPVLFPGLVHGAESSVIRRVGRQRGKPLYVTAWNYVYLSGSQIIGVPKLR